MSQDQVIRVIIMTLITTRKGLCKSTKAIKSTIVAHAVVVAIPQVPLARQVTVVTVPAIAHALCHHITVESPETAATLLLAGNPAARNVTVAETAAFLLLASARTLALMMTTGASCLRTVVPNDKLCR